MEEKTKFETFLEEIVFATPTQVELIISYVKENFTALDESTKDTIDRKKQKFYKQIKQYISANPNKYPKQLYEEFFIYWSEVNKTGKLIRYDDEKFFEIGKRMGTFAKIAGQEKLNKMWEEHWKEQKNKQPELL